MAKFIDSDFFRGVLNRMVEHLEAVGATRDAETIKSVIRFLKVMEEFHAVDVVRCKDCKEWLRNRGVVDSPNGHCFYHETHMNGYDFCSYGERRTDERKAD